MKERTLLILTSVMLTLIGVIMVFSASGIYAEVKYDNPYFFLKRELLWCVIGFGGVLFVRFLKYETLKSLVPFFFIFALILVGLTYSDLGVRVGGAKRWLQLYFVRIQPSEFLKLGFISLLAMYLSREQKKPRELWNGFMVPLMIVFLAASPILFQPDFGTAFMVLLVGMIMIFVSGTKLRYIFCLGGALIPPLYLLIVKYPYRLKRILTFLDPWQDPRGAGFQIVQSFLAIGRGEWFGVGLGQSKQKMFYLPEAHTDFIFSILAEETGFAGCMLVIFLFVLFMICGVRIALKSRDEFGLYLALGVTFLISFQALFNIAVVTGSVLTKGIPLPFLSFGGSNMIINWLMVGVLLQISKWSEVQERTYLKEKVFLDKKRQDLVKKQHRQRFRPLVAY